LTFGFLGLKIYKICTCLVSAIVAAHLAELFPLKLQPASFCTLRHMKIDYFVGGFHQTLQEISFA